MRFGSGLADKTLPVVSSSCRDTDYIGWYREGRILGVILTAVRSDSAGKGLDSLMTRVRDRLQDALTLTDDHFLQICVLEHDKLAAFNAFDDPAPLPGSKD